MFILQRNDKCIQFESQIKTKEENKNRCLYTRQKRIEIDSSVKRFVNVLSTHTSAVQWCARACMIHMNHTPHRCENVFY